MERTLAVAVCLLCSVAVSAADPPARPYSSEPLPRGARACLGSPRFMGDNGAGVLAFSPDGKLLAVGHNQYSSHPDIDLWDLSDGRVLRTLKGHAKGVRALRFTPDGKRLLSAGQDDTVRVWDVAAGKEERQFKYAAARYSPVFSPDGKRILVSSTDASERESFIRIWNTTTGKELQPVASGGYLSLSADGKMVAATDKGTVHVWNLDTGRQVAEFGGKEPYLLTVAAVAPDGKVVAGFVWDMRVVLWDAATGKEIRRFGEPRKPGDEIRQPYWLAFSPDGTRLITHEMRYDGPGIQGSFTVLKVWDVATGKELLSWRPEQRALTDLVFAPDGRTFATCTVEDTVRLWDLTTGREDQRFTGHAWNVSALAFSPDGGTLYSSGHDGTVRVWDVAGGTDRTLVRYTGLVWSLALTPDGKTLATVAHENPDPPRLWPSGPVRLWDTATGRETGQLGRKEDGTRVLAFSPDGKTLVTDDRDREAPAIRLWDWRAGKELRRFEGGGGCVAFSPDGRALTSGQSGGLGIWDVETGKIRRQISSPQRGGPWGVGFLADGTVVTVGYTEPRPMQPERHAVRVWDPGGKREREFLFEPGRSVFSTLAVSRDGKLLAAAYGQTIRVWDAATRKQVCEFTGHRRFVISLAFGPNGKTLASGGADGAILLWDLPGPG